MPLKKKLFEFIDRTADTIAPEIIRIGHDIHACPELGFKEEKTSAILRDYMEKQGFKINHGNGQLSTAARGDISTNPGINVAFLSEMDALPIGHACGHNLIAASGVGAAILFAKAVSEFNLRANSVWMATPSEEGGGGKALMVMDGWFEGIDYAMMIHPCDRTMVGDYTLASQLLEIKFHGLSAHSTGSPWDGRNALSALTQTMSMIDAWRMQFHQTTRISGFIKSGGGAVNVIPALTELSYLARAEDTRELGNVVGIVENCADCAAKAFGCSAQITKGVLYEPVNNDAALEKYMSEGFEYLGETVVDRSTTKAVGSTDMGNVTQYTRGIHGHLYLCDHPTHTVEFMEAAGDYRGERYSLTAAKAMAMTGVLLALDPDCNP